MAKNGMSGNINGFEIVEDNTQEILHQLEDCKTRILTMWGMKAETYAKKNLTAKLAANNAKRKEYGYKLTGNLRNSITFKVRSDEDAVSIGSDVYYAPYIELGTLNSFEPPEEWEEFTSQKGSGKRHGTGIKPFHFLRDAIRDHLSEYAEIFRNELSNN